MFVFVSSDVVYRAGLVLWLAVVPAGKCGQKLWETRGMNKQTQRTIGLQGAGETNSKQQKLEEAQDIARNSKTQVSRKQQTTGPQTKQPTATITTTIIGAATAATATTNSSNDTINSNNAGDDDYNDKDNNNHNNNNNRTTTTTTTPTSQQQHQQQQHQP